MCLDSIRAMKYRFFPLIAAMFTGCATPEAAFMTLGGNGQYKTEVKNWQNSIAVDEVQGGDRPHFSGKEFRQALQQTLVNVGFASPVQKSEFNLEVQVLEALGTRFSLQWAGVLKTRYTLRSARNETLLSEDINSMCFSSATVPPDPKSVMEDCGRQNIKSLLVKLEQKGREFKQARSESGK